MVGPMKYPTANQIENATKFDLCKWLWQLPSPKDKDQMETYGMILKQLKIGVPFTRW